MKKTLKKIDFLEISAKAAALRLCRTQMTNGSFLYQYQADQDKIQNTPYNMTRMAGTTFAMAKIASQIKTKEKSIFQNATLNAINFLLKNEQIHENQHFIIEGINGSGSTGTLSLTTLALLQNMFNEKTLKEKFEQKTLNFINTLLNLQRKNGSLKAFILQTKQINDKQAYFPGEVLFTLATYLKKCSKNETQQKIIHLMERAFPFYQQMFSKNPHPGMILWHTHAWTILNEIMPKQIYVNFVFQMNDWIIKKQFSKQSSPFQHFMGGFHVSSIPGISTATFTEAIIIALQIAKQQNDKERMNQYQNAAIQGIDFCQNLQVVQAKVFKNPALTLGGFVKNPASFKMRNDYDQHAITCFLTAIENDLFKIEKK